MGNNKQFDAILNECLENLLAGKETGEQCLQRYPEYATELEPLLRTATIMNKAVDVKPSADFRARARYQLQSMMAESKAPKRATRFVPRWAIAVCAVLLVFVLGGGTVLAADGSMPGNPLYAVKLATENLSIKLAGSEEKKVELYATFADRRVMEMTQLVEDGKTQYLEISVQRLNNYYAKISESPSILGGKLTFDGTATSSAPVPPTTESIKATDYTPATTPVTTVAQTYSSPASLSGSRNNLINNLNYYAATQPEKIQELIDSDKVPESVKPALRRALWASENIYIQAINNLTP